MFYIFSKHKELFNYLFKHLLKYIETLAIGNFFSYIILSIGNFIYYNCFLSIE